MNSVTFPNTFIIGAPKCGTTALSRYLGEHPQVFFSTPKEPNFLATEYPGIHFVHSMHDYRTLFQDAQPHHQIIAEGSVWYLYSDSALDSIADNQPDAKIILMLRHPVSFLASYFAHLRRSFTEDQTNFESAWNLQEERAAGRAIPEGCRIPFALQYGSAASFGSALQNVLKRFSADQVHVILYEDFASNPAAVYRQTLTFLGIDDDGRRDFTPVNIASEPRSSAIARLIHRPPGWARGAWSVAKWLFGPSLTRIPETIMTMNSRAVRPSSLSTEMSRVVMNSLSEDIALLSELLMKHDLTDEPHPVSSHPLRNMR